MLVPLLICGALLQITVPLARIATSYTAIEMNLPAVSLALLSSAFALLPVLLAVTIGRYNDKKGESFAAVLGAAVILAAVTGLELASPNLPALLLFTCLLGIGHVLLVAAMQMATTRCSGPEHHDTVLGHFLVATSLGQAAGPLLITLTTPAGAAVPGDLLTWVILAMAGILLVCTWAMVKRLPPHAPEASDTTLPIRSLLAVPGLFIIIVASSLIVTAVDLLIVYFPAVGTSRNLDAALVGTLLSARAAASIASRLLFARLATALGKPLLLTLSVGIGGLATVGLLIDLPVWWLAILLCLFGFATGAASAASISLALAIAPAGMRATTVTLRLTANRIASFLIPLAAGGTTAIIGASGVFAFTGVAMISSSISTVRLWRR